MPASQMTEYWRDLSRRGFSNTKTRGGHWKIEHPDMDGPVFAADTPSDHRTLRNLDTMIRRKMRAKPRH